MGQYDAEIARLKAILDSGTKDVSADGLRTSFDLDSVRKQLNELEPLNDPASPNVRPKQYRNRMSGSW